MQRGTAAAWTIPPPPLRASEWPGALLHIHPAELRRVARPQQCSAFTGRIEVATQACLRPSEICRHCAIHDSYRGCGR